MHCWVKNDNSNMFNNIIEIYAKRTRKQRKNIKKIIFFMLLLINRTNCHAIL